MFKLVSRQFGAKVVGRGNGRFYSTIKKSPSLSVSGLVIGASFGLSGVYICNQYLVSNEIDQEKLKEARKAAFEQVQKESVSKLISDKPLLKDDTIEKSTEVLEDLKSEAEKESEENGQQAAYNPETGEINWDCPCLGGMAHGPCGEEFKEAFSCFVYSEAEPKGIDCIKKFENMRNCFREHPEHYKEELYDDDDQENTAATPSNETVEKPDQTPADPEKTQAAVDQVQSESTSKLHTDQNSVDETKDE